ncbi:dynamin family protein [Acinetobacter bohemicus]|uniref:dynamin family protein n=1 Tax=Acinetobacter bohemicus TaxID=1435036 RepID=UPI00192C79D3|nr:dynamin family protein [Acinetobacter bohemicus]CAD9196522.1 hypothetical protein QAC21B_02669 [Acinetobacter bohemicus]
MNQPLILNTLSTILNSGFSTSFLNNDLYQQIIRAIELSDPQNLLVKQQQLKQLVEHLNQSIFSTYLDQKCVIGFGGGFSAGKSRFLNTFLSIDYLPEALEPCTAVPTYIGYSETSSYLAKNLFQQNLELSLEQVQQLSHLFDSTSTDQPLQLAQLLEHIYLGLENFKWQHLTFLDTPGYSKADSQHQSRTDEKIALEQLRQVDHLVWLVSAKNGTIREDDLKFLAQVGVQKPVFIVVTQSDLVTSKELPAILESIKSSLKRENVHIAGVMAWAAPIHSAKGQILLGDDIHVWLEKVNTSLQSESNFEQLIAFIDNFVAELESKSKNLEQHIQHQQQIQKKLPLDLSQELEKNLHEKSIKQSRYERLIDQLVESQSNLYFDYAHLQLVQGKQHDAVNFMVDAASLGMSHALDWLQTEKNNFTYIQYKLAGMYERGAGVKKDIDYAINQYIEVLIAGDKSSLIDLNRWVDQYHRYAIERLADYYEEYEKDALKAEQYHQRLVKKFYSQTSLDWYYQQSLERSSPIFQSFVNNFALRDNSVVIQFTYARILFAHGEIDKSIETMSKYVGEIFVRKWLEKHESSCPQIRFQLAKLHAIGLCYPKNIDLALSKYKALVEEDYRPALDALTQMAVENKYAEGFVCIGQLYENKFQDINTGITYYLEAIKLERSDALDWLSAKAKQELSQAVVVLRDLSRESNREDLQLTYIKYLEKTATVDDPAQVISLEAVNFNNQMAYQWIKSYAETGNEQARWYFIDFYQHELVKSEQDRNIIAQYCYVFAVEGDEKAIARLKPIAETHGGEASYILGLIYSFGYAVKQNLKEASYYFEKAHRDGMPVASYNFAAIPSQSNINPYGLLKDVACHNIIPAQKITSFPGNLFYFLGILRAKPVDFYLSKIKGLRINWLILLIYLTILSGVVFTAHKHPEILQNIKNSIVKFWTGDNAQQHIDIQENAAIDIVDIYNSAELVATFYPNTDKDIWVQGVYEYQSLENETRYLIPVLSDYDQGRNVCNACQAPIDFFVFKKQGEGYKLVARNEANTILTIGHGTDNSMINQLSGNVVPFGPNKQGLLLTSRWGGSGQTAEDAFLILIDEQGGLIRNIAHESMALEKGEGYIGSEFTSKYHFDESSEHEGIYDFIIEQEGTALDENREVIPHHRKLIYRYRYTNFELLKDENLLVSKENQQDDLDFLKCLGLKDGDRKESWDAISNQMEQYFKLMNNPDEYEGDYYESIYQPKKSITLFGAEIKSLKSFAGYGGEIVPSVDELEMIGSFEGTKLEMDQYFNNSLNWHQRPSINNEIYTYTKGKEGVSGYMLTLSKNSDNEFTYRCTYLFSEMQLTEENKGPIKQVLNEYIAKGSF